MHLRQCEGKAALGQPQCVHNQCSSRANFDFILCHPCPLSAHLPVPAVLLFHGPLTGSDYCACFLKRIAGRLWTRPCGPSGHLLPLSPPQPSLTATPAGEGWKRGRAVRTWRACDLRTWQGPEQPGTRRLVQLQLPITAFTSHCCAIVGFFDISHTIWPPQILHTHTSLEHEPYQHSATPLPALLTCSLWRSAC